VQASRTEQLGTEPRAALAHRQVDAERPAHFTTDEEIAVGAADAVFGAKVRADVAGHEEVLKVYLGGTVEKASHLPVTGQGIAIPGLCPAGGTEAEAKRAIVAFERAQAGVQAQIVDGDPGIREPAGAHAACLRIFARERVERDR
jgi:hypothetical protein